MPNSIPSNRRAQVRSRARDRCERCGSPTNAGQWHHRRRRGVKEGHYQHCACNGVWLCGICHTDVHSRNTEARQTGFIVNQFVATPGDQLVQTYRGPAYLTCDGKYQFAETEK